MNESNFDKLDLTLKYYLYGAKYSRAIQAYHLAKKWHRGFRKDGVTPEVQHQLEIALFIITLKLKPEDEELAIIYALLHDLMEDNKDFTRRMMIDSFDVDIFEDLATISKYIEGERTYVELEQYFNRMAKRPLVALVKGVDRIHNLQSMQGVFDLKKQKQYVEEAVRFFLPMLKEAAKINDDLFFSFQNVRTVLKCQVALIEAVIAASEVKADNS